MKHLYVDTDIGTPGDGTSWAQAENKLSDAIADLPADLTADDSYTIHCKGTTADATAVSINAHETDATHTITIQCDAADRHSGVWTTSKYRLVTTAATAFITYEDYVNIDHLQIGMLSPTGDGLIAISIGGATASNINISNCIVKASGDATYLDYGIYIDAANANVNVWNTYVYSATTVASGYGIIVSSAATTNVYNTVIGKFDRGLRNIGGTTVTAKNVYAGGQSSQCYFGTIGMTTCGSSDTSGSVGLQSIAYNTTQFVNVSAGTEDLHLKDTGSALYHTGTDTSGDAAPLNFTTDIDGDAYYDTGGLRSIGADEIGEISGSVCWGHSTGVTQDNTRTFATNWTGTGAASGSGDTEVLTLDSGDNMESEIVNTGATTWTIALNQYDTGDNVTIKYKTAATSAGIAGASWTTYSGAFESSGYVKIRLEHTTQ